MGEIEVDKEHKAIIIHSHFYLYGDAATEEMTKQFYQEIEELWNEAEAVIEFDEAKFQVIFKMKGFYVPYLTKETVMSNTNPKNNYFRVEDFSPLNISWVDGIGSNTGYMFTENLYVGSTTGAHEYGHTLGLEHPENLVILGQGRPGIMYPRGTWVDPEYQYEPMVSPGEKGGTLHPKHRRVLQSDIDALQLPVKLLNNIRHLGKFSSLFHARHRKSEIV